MQPEPWLRGPLLGVPPFLQPLFFSFQQVREDLARFTEGLDDEDAWCDVEGSCLGFHIRHMAGSIERLTAYLFQEPLTSAQLQGLRNENEPDMSLDDLIRHLHSAIEVAESRLFSLDPAQLCAPRAVGREFLPTTVMGLLTHMAEHTQRHLGQAIIIAKLVRHSG